MTERESGLRTHLGYWLRQLSDLVHISFERQLAQHDVTVAQWNVLVTIYQEHAETTSEVARYTNNDPAAVSRLVDRLISKDLLTRTADPDSRRRLLLALTPSARRLVPTLIAIADRNDEQFFASLEAAQREQLHGLLQELTITNRTKDITQ
jgi:DNA-binding MarR family transcriptional regulator